MNDIPQSVRQGDVFRFPQRFLYGEVVLFSLVSTLMIFAWIPALISFFSYGGIVGSALRAAIFLNITAVALLLLFFFIKGELRATTFYLDDLVLVRRTSGRISKLLLSDIVKISLIKYPFGGGVLVVDGPEKTIHIPLIVQPVEELVTRLKHICESGSLACPYQPELWRQVERVAGLSRLIDERSYRFFSPMLSLSITMLPLHILIGAFFWNMSVIPLAVWTIFGPLFPLAGYALADLLIRKAAVKAPVLFPQADTAFRTVCDVIFVRVAALSVAGYCIAAMLFKSMVLHY